MRTPLFAAAFACALPAHAGGYDYFEHPAFIAQDARSRAAARADDRGAAATATGNSVTIIQEGRGNSLDLTITQDNTGGVGAAVDGEFDGTFTLD